MNPNYLPVPALYDLLMSCTNFVPDERPNSTKALIEVLESIGSYGREKVSNEPDETQAYFNEAITYVKNEQLDKAYALLQEIPTTDKKAQQLSEKIKIKP
ncbi:MAG: hypothetical protein ABFS56_22860 [Pseudomonadota bacterium]